MSKPFGSKSRPFGNTKGPFGTGEASNNEESFEQSSISAHHHDQNSPSHQPSQPPPEVLDLAVYLGIDPRDDADLLWIAEECLAAELPPGWSEHTSSRGDIYFYNADTDESTPKHPLEDQYRVLFEEEKRKKLKREVTLAQARRSSAEISAADDESAKPIPISIQEVLQMSEYYGVQPEVETHLLQTVRQAVLAPLPWMYHEVSDSEGSPYYYNSETDESQRPHPLDDFFKGRLQELRDEAEEAGEAVRAEWQVFFSSNGAPVWYNFCTSEERTEAPEGMADAEGAVKEQAHADRISARLQPFGEPPREEGEEVEEGMEGELSQQSIDPYEGVDDKVVQEYAQLLDLRPSNPKLQKFVQELEERRRTVTQSQTWTTTVPAHDRVDLAPPKMRPPPPAPKPKLLVFFSWWFEEGQKKYIELRYHMNEKVFQIVLNKTVELNDVKIAGRDGELLQCWDLFVGQKIGVLGKPTTLMQANHATLQWLEFHTRRLLKKAMELENEIMQFKPIPEVVHKILHTKKLSNGSISLRWIMRHISILTTQLYRLKPSASK
uniref:WW domain-containing protein n=1 Tax=Hemiselmis andersenii TaxID=464988 RepID=A0A6T8LZ23_HEMAN